MFEPACPSCHRKVGLFTPGWQAQRASTSKVCPFCGVKVVPKHRASTYLFWFTCFLAAGAMAGFLIGPYGFSAFFVGGLVVPLLLSIYLEHEA